MHEQTETSKRPLWLRQAPATIVGVLVMAVVGSLLYDLVVKPGVTGAGRLFLDVFTLGSTSLRDAAYSSAALNPTPISALILLQAGLIAIAGPAIRMLTRRKTNSSLASLRRKASDAPEEVKKQLAEEIAKLERRLRRLTVVFWLIFIPWWLSLFVAYQVHNQSVAVWRVFHANLNILTPTLTVDDRSRLLAKFASMKTRADYSVVLQEMRLHASKHAVALREEETW